MIRTLQRRGGWRGMTDGNDRATKDSKQTRLGDC